MRTVPPLKPGQVKLKFNNDYVGSATELGNGMPVTVNDTNKKIEPITSAATRGRNYSSNINTAASGYHAIMQDPTTGVYIFAYSIGNYPYVRAGRLRSRYSGDYFDLGTAVQLNTSYGVSSPNMCLCHMSMEESSTSDRTLVVWADSDQNRGKYALLRTKGDLTLDLVATGAFNSSMSVIGTSIAVCYDKANRQAVIAYGNATTSNYLTTTCGRVASNGTDMSWGAHTQLNGLTIVGHPRMAYDEARGKVVIAFVDGADSEGKCVVGNASDPNTNTGGVFSSGSLIEFAPQAGATNFVIASGINEWVFDVVYDKHHQRIVFLYSKSTDSYSGYAVTAEVGGGNSLTFGTEAKWSGSLTGAYKIRGAYNSKDHTIGVFFQYSSNKYVTTFKINSSTGNTLVTNPRSENVEGISEDDFAKPSFKYDIYNDTFVMAWVESGFGSNNYPRVLTAYPNNVLGYQSGKTNVIGVNIGGHITTDDIPTTIATINNLADTKTTMTPGKEYYLESSIEPTYVSKPFVPDNPDGLKLILPRNPVSGISVATSSTDSNGKILITSPEYAPAVNGPFSEPVRGWRGGYNGY